MSLLAITPLFAYIRENNALLSLIENLLITYINEMHEISSLTFARGVQRGRVYCIAFCKWDKYNALTYGSGKEVN